MWVTPWDAFRYAFWGGLGLSITIGLIAIICWLYDHASEIYRTRSNDASTVKSNLEWAKRENLELRNKLEKLKALNGGTE